MPHHKKLLPDTLTLLFLTILSLLFLPPGIYAADAESFTTLQQVLVPSAAVPAGWRLDREISANEQMLLKFKQIYNVPAQEIINQIFYCADQKMQINYTRFDSSSTAELIALKMRTLVGEANIVLEEANVVIEIISASAFLKQQALELIRPDPAYHALLTRNRVPADWEFWKIIFAEKAKVALLETKLGGQIDTVINQFFRTKDGNVRINYAACADETAAAAVLESLRKTVGDQNIILRHGNVIIEIISDQGSLKTAARELFG